MKNKILFFLFFLLNSLSVFTQIPDTILNETSTQDTLIIDKETLIDSTLINESKQKKKEGFLYRVWKKDYPNPKKALYLSFVFPGTGQIYNKRWWKVPLVYGAVGGLVYAIDFNTRNYKRFRDAYIAELNDEIHEFTGTQLDAGDIKRIRDGYDKNRQLSYIGFVAVYLIQGVEAFVDAHLRTFDVSDDLSLKIKPAFDSTPFQEPIVGLGVSFQIGKRSRDLQQFTVFE